MVMITVGFHADVQLPASAKGLDGSSILLQSSWTVRELSLAIEQQCATSAGLGIRVCALINPARDRAASPHELAVNHFNAGDRAMVLADVQSSPWPSMDLPVRSRRNGGPVPITIFTGFLGAGKTTVLNHLLLNQRDKKFAVIENEFGEVPIDHELIQNSALELAEQVIVMENGCMCCTIRGDLLGAFDAIRRQMESGKPLDAVLVETTGMADPVPIVRTLRQTPDIAKYFQLDGTITLVDAKTIIARLGECEKGQEDQERHHQIAFADRILLNKLDLVSEADVVDVWRQIRSYNSIAPIIASVKGVVPSSLLTNIGAYDIERIASEHEEPVHSGHGDGHGHGHGNQEHGSGHECSDDCNEDHGDQSHGHIHGHSRSSMHDSDVGSFSIVRKGVEVEPLAFARWIRIISTLPAEKGHLYRSKGILAAVGRTRKLIFHAVADITELSEGPEWLEHEERMIKIVFIGRKLARKEIEERFMELLHSVKPMLRPSLQVDSESIVEHVSLEFLASTGVIYRALLGCWSKDVVRLSQVSARFHDLLHQPKASAALQLLNSRAAKGTPCGFHTVKGEFWLHGALSLASIRTYVLAWRQSEIQLKTPSSIAHLYGEPLAFDDMADVEAAGVMWLELSETAKSGTINLVTEFKWRSETMQSFFDIPGSATNSALVKVTVQDPGGDSDLDDDLKFRVNLNPETSDQAVGLALHRLTLQLVGGKSSSHVYQIFFHTVDPAYQIHINVPDHRVPIFPTKEVFHQWHPLMAGLKRRPRLRFLIRCRPMESGPLDAMCGCCG